MTKQSIKNALSVLSLLAFSAQPLFALVDFGAEGAFHSETATAPGYDTAGNQVTNTIKFSGPVFTPYAHLNHTFASLITVGVGPYLSVGKLTGSSIPTWADSEKITLIRYGADLMLTLSVAPIIKPYVRFSLGKESVEWTENGRTSLVGINYVSVADYSTTQYQAAIGGLFRLAGPLSLFVQAGIIGGLSAPVTLKSFTLNGSPVTLTNQNPSEGKHSGFILGAGLHFSL